MSAAEQPTGDEPAGGPAHGVALTEAVRQELVEVAAQVVGRVPVDELPASLRSIARFTPAKRARLGGPPLAAALDADDGFRARVLEVIEQTWPDLVAAVRQQESTAASDPVHAAVVLYLVRPAGWEAALAAANERWALDRATASGADGEIARLRDELAEARARTKAETARAKAAAAASTSDLTAEIADLKRQLRARTGELRSAERARDEALTDRAELERRLATASSAHDAELRRVRARVAELERAAESARRGARTDRDVDDARLWLLVETLTDAAAGVRRELSLAAPTIRPADTVTSGDGGDEPRRADDAASLDRLLSVPNVHVIVDGYNVTKTGYGELSLAAQRTRLVGSLATLRGRSGAEITVAFDGGTKPPAQPPTPRGVRVLFSSGGQIADDLIRALVDAEPPGRPLVVVTSDQQVVADVRRRGAWTVASAVLLERLS